MQAFFDQFFCVALTAALVCGNASGTDQLSALESRIQTAPAKIVNALLQQGGIVGDWKLSIETYDENQNKKLDPQERAKAFSNHFFFRFNADGSALVNFNVTAEHAFKAKYKLSKRKDLQFISVYIDGDDNEGPDGLSGGYYIISVDKSEMVLLEAAMERAIWIFKKS